MPLNLSVKNTITFNRIPYYLCKEYILKIIHSDSIEEEIKIPNTQTSNPVTEKKELEYNDSLTWRMPVNIIATNTLDIKVIINNVEIDSIYYNYNKADRLITISELDVTPNDTIEIEIKCDKISYEYFSTGKFSYRVYPIYSNNYTIGQHTKI